MIEPQSRADEEVSLFALGTTLLRYRRRIAICALIGGVVAVVPVLMKKALYSTTASFVPQGADVGRSGLASLAGQFGVGIPTGNLSQSPDFYADLLDSRELLAPIVQDTFQVPEVSPRPQSFVQVVGLQGGSQPLREDAAVKRLRTMVSTSVNKATGVVEIKVSTEWPSFSFAVAKALIDRIDQFNRRTRQSQAAAERKFLEGRLTLASVELRAAEDRLQKFLQTNRDVGGSAGLSFQRDRLQREVGLQQQVFTSMTQAYEDARVREVRDTPVITVIESPTLPVLPEPRGRARRALIGLLLGGLLGLVFVFASEMVARRRHAADPAVDEFFGALDAAKADVLRPFRRAASRRQS